MIPLLVIPLIKIFYAQVWANRGLKISKFLKKLSRFFFTGLLVILFTIISTVSRSQSLHLNYTITKGGDNIGWLRLEKHIAGNTTKLLMVSEIKTRIIFMITGSAKDSSAFENNKMIYSSQFRQTNGNTKQNKQTRLVADKYEVSENGEKENLSIPYIGINLLSLHFQEPVGINTVYCDISKCFAPIIKTADGGYKVKRPDGNSNTFYYRGGKCIKIIICQSLYTVTIILNQ
jgi:hypothetical protein